MRYLLITSVLCWPVAAQCQDANPPPNTPTDIGERVYVGDTGTYDATLALGQIGIVENGRVTMFVDKPYSPCSSDKMLSSAKVTQMPGARALSITVSKGYSGSLSFFVASAELSDDQKGTLTVDDLATAQLSNPCSYRSRDISRIAATLPIARGKRVIYVTGTTLSHLAKGVYDKQDASGGISAGSWLKVGADAYKSNERLDSVPITSVRGFYVDVLGSPHALSGTPAGGEKPFAKLSDLGTTGVALKVAAPVKAGQAR